MKADFYPSFLTQFQQNGKQLGLPADIAIYYIAYNADLLNQKGIPLPKDGWTVDDLLSIASQAADPSASKPVYGYANADEIFRSMGILWYDNRVQPLKPTINSEDMLKTFTWLQQQFQKKTLYQVVYYTYSDYLDMIPKGQVAMWTSTGFLNYNTDPWGALRQPMFDQNLPFKVGYVTTPLTASGRAMSMPMWSLGYYISSQASQAKAQGCWEWIKYLSDHPTIFGGYSPRQSVLPKEGVGQDPARLAVIQASIEQYNADDYADFSDPLLWVYTQEEEIAMQAVFQGGNVASALAAAQSASEAYLACISQKDLKELNNLELFAQVQTCWTIPTPPATPNP